VEILAPIDGVVTHIDVTIGQAVDRTQELMDIENLDSIWVTASVQEADAAKVAAGNLCRVSTSTGEIFKGVIQLISGRIDPETRTMPVQCLITGAAGQLKPNMFADVEIAYGEASDMLAVPSSALIVEKSGHHALFTKDDHGFEPRDVEVGLSAGGYTQILEGLEEGDTVVTAGVLSLKAEQDKSGLAGHAH
jgi:Cu(I)/Ag(I) efflux system membrane fusion protein